MTSTTRRWFATLWSLSLVGALILVTPAPGLGQERHKISWSVKAENYKYTFQHNLDIPDITGHILRMNEARVTWPDGGGPVVEGQKVVEEISRVIADYVAGNGHLQGYAVWRFENGDQLFGQSQATVQTVVTPDRSRKTTLVGTYVTTGGTGRLKGIKGLGRYSGRTEFDADGKATLAEYSAEGEYWFEK
jgi:hypothetical protein